MPATLIAQPVLCASCSWALPPEIWSQPPDPGAAGQAERRWTCRGCGTSVQVTVFPAIARANAAATPEPKAGEAEAACFYHAHNRAVKPCDECGRFLCGLCEIGISGRILCPACFNAQASERKIQQVDNRRTMHDSIALALATWPALLFWPVIVTAPMTLYWVFRYWNAPSSILPRTRVRFYLAVLIAIGQIAGIILMIIGLTIVSRTRPR